MSNPSESIIKNYESVNKKGNIFNSITLSMINTLLILLFFYNIFSSSYLPQKGTAIILSIIVGCALIFIFTNIFIRGFSVNGTNIFDVLFKSNPLTGMNSQLKTITEILMFRVFNSFKMLFIVIIGIILSVMFFKYDTVINKYHNNIPSFDTFFGLAIFSLLAQSIYLTTGHFTYNNKSSLNKYFSTSLTSFLGFALLNIITLLFITSMWTEIVYSLTDG